MSATLPRLMTSSRKRLALALFSRVPMGFLRSTGSDTVVSNPSDGKRIGV